MMAHLYRIQQLFVYLLWRRATVDIQITVVKGKDYWRRLNVFQCQKFCHWTKAYFVKICYTVQPAIFNYTVSGKVNKQTTCNSSRKLIKPFLPRDAMHKRGMPSCGGCLCVRLSVTFVDHVKTNKRIFKLFYHRVAKSF